MDELIELSKTLEVILTNIRKSVNRPYTKQTRNERKTETENIYVKAKEIYGKLLQIGLDSREQKTVDILIKNISERRGLIFEAIKDWDDLESKDNSQLQQAASSSQSVLNIASQSGSSSQIDKNTISQDSKSSEPFKLQFKSATTQSIPIFGHFSDNQDLSENKDNSHFTTNSNSSETNNSDSNNSNSNNSNSNNLNPNTSNNSNSNNFNNSNSNNSNSNNSDSNNSDNNSNGDSVSNNEEHTMANSPSLIEFLKLCASTLNTPFEGDPLKLDAFCNAIALLTPIASTPELQSTLFNFIKTKLIGKALESIPTNADSIQIIVDSLREKIKPESSRVVEGRLAALKTDRQSLQQFAKTAEELAEALKRSLIIEGMTSQKANEMAVEKTVKMCRSSARTDLVKSVLAASKFNDAKEVISTFIVEIGQEAEERKVLAYNVSKKHNKKYNNNNKRGFDSNRGRKNKYNHYNNRRQNNRNNFPNQNNQNDYNSSRKYKNNANQNVRYAAGNSQQPVQEQPELVMNQREI